MNRSNRTRRQGVVLSLMLVLAFGLSACTGGGSGSPAPQAPDAATPPPPPPAKVAMEPGKGAKDVAPAGPVQVSVTDGTIQSVTLTNPEDEQVSGELAPDRRSWSTTEPLGFGKTYTWSGTALGGDGKEVPIAGSFTTVQPGQVLTASSNVGDGKTYGIAMPIAITFRDAAGNPVPVGNKAAVEEALTVESSGDDEGSWAWLHNDTSVHWRPKEYWQPNNEVEVTANLYGVELDDGVYGRNDLTVNFEIGRSQVAKGNTQTHRMQVVRDGDVVADYPVSYGLDSDPGRVTHSGTHVVMSKHSTYFMTNARYDYEDFKVHWAVRISNNGEFTHAAPWSVGDQGERNVSHGCLNLSTEDAKEYYDSALIGDPVEIEGSTQELGPEDGDYHDWTYSWDEWTARSALNK